MGIMLAAGLILLDLTATLSLNLHVFPRATLVRHLAFPLGHLLLLAASVVAVLL